VQAFNVWLCRSRSNNTVVFAWTTLTQNVVLNYGVLVELFIMITVVYVPKVNILSRIGKNENERDKTK
jgi:magnesium-transporting ATPase (P-type)